MRTHVRILRACFEHWDERDGAEAKSGSAGRAYRQFAKLGLGEEPDAYRFGPSDTSAGGLSLDQLEEVCLGVHGYLLDLEAGDFVWHGWSSVGRSSENT